MGVRKRGVMLAEKRRLPDERGQASASLLVVSRSAALNLGVAKDAAAYVVLNAILIAVWFIGSRGYVWPRSACIRRNCAAGHGRSSAPMTGMFFAAKCRLNQYRPA